MALVSELFSRQLNFSGRRKVSLQWMLRDLCCHYEDEVFLHGGLTGVPVPPFACKFTPDGLYGNLLAAADEEGSVRLMDTARPASKSLVKELAAHTNAIFDIAWLPGGIKLLTASGDTTVRLWDVVGGVSLASFRAHSGSIKSVDVKADEPTVLVSGGRDGNIMVWDTRCSTRGSQHKPVNCISLAHKKADPSHAPGGRKRRRGHRVNPPQKTMVDSQHSVTAVLFHGSDKLASSGAADGTVKLWDLRRTYTHCLNGAPLPWHTFAQTGDPARPFGFTCLISDPFQSCLFASCTDDIIYKYDCSGLKKNPVCGFSGHRNSTFYVKAAVGVDGRYLISGSSCGNAFIWEVDQPDSPPLLLSGHSKEVTAVSWCPTQPDKLATCSDNNDIRLWRVVRKRKSFPGEFIGTCEQYKGEGHLKAADVMKKYATKTVREVERTPLKPVHNLPQTSPQTASSQTARKQQKKPKSPDEKQTGLLRFLTPKRSSNEAATTVVLSSTPLSPSDGLSSEIGTSDNRTLDSPNGCEAVRAADGSSSNTLLPLLGSSSSPRSAYEREGAWKMSLNAGEQKLQSRTTEVQAVATCLELKNSPRSNSCSVSSDCDSPCVHLEATPERAGVFQSQSRKRKLQCLNLDLDECAGSASHSATSVSRERVKQIQKQQHLHHRDSSSGSGKGKRCRGKNSSNGAGHHKQVAHEGGGKTCRGLPSYFTPQTNILRH